MTRRRTEMRTPTKMKRKDPTMSSPITSRLWPGPGAATWADSSRASERASPPMPEAPTGPATQPQSCSRMCGTSSLTSRITCQRTPMSGLSLGAGGLGSPRRMRTLVRRRTGREFTAMPQTSFAISGPYICVCTQLHSLHPCAPVCFCTHVALSSIWEHLFRS